MTKYYSEVMDRGVKIEKLNGFSDVAGTNSPISSTNFIDSLSDLFYRGRSMAYGRGEVSMCGHMLQTAELAAEAGAAPSLLVACLLHDVGHFGTDYPLYFNNESHSHMQTASQDLHHEEAGAIMLTPFFGPDVIEPIRLHVAAKRYLCATDPDYAVQLSTTTSHTLGLQGGDHRRIYELRKGRGPVRSGHRALYGFAGETVGTVLRITDCDAFERVENCEFVLSNEF